MKIFAIKFDKTSIGFMFTFYYVNTGNVSLTRETIKHALFYKHFAVLDIE